MTPAIRSAPIDWSVRTARMTMMIEGGMSAASVPEAATHPAATPRLYLYRSISGSVILVNTLAETTVEPEAAPKPAAARMVDM
jgi:hypothetical protein